MNHYYLAIGLTMLMNFFTPRINKEGFEWAITWLLQQGWIFLMFSCILWGLGI